MTTSVETGAAEEKKAREAAARAEALRNVGRYTEIAAKMLAGHNHKQDRRPAVAQAFGRALAATSPRSGHGQLLAAALRPGLWRERPAAERAALKLARRGETPTEAALEAWLEGARRRRERDEQARSAVAACAEAGGPRAAEYVATVVRDTDQGPTWAELSQAMDWPRQPWHLRGAVIHQLAREGWLQFTSEPRSLRPGPAARSLANGRRG
jgi:hypothetical protein